MIFSETNIPVKLIIYLTTTAALSSIALIYIINTAAEHAADPEKSISLIYFLAFMISFVIYFFSKKIAFIKSMAMVENLVKNIRVRISDKVRYANLESIEKIGLSTIQTRLSIDTVTVSNSSYIIISAVQSILILVFGILYILYLSTLAFFITFAAIVTGAFVYRFYNDIVVIQIDKSLREDNRFFTSLLNIIDGFNELKINHEKSDAVIKNHTNIANENEKVRNETSALFANSSTLVQFLVYFLLGTIVFAIPQISDTQSDVVIKIVSVIIFIMAPIETITAAVPTFSRANRSALLLNQLENDIDKYADYSKYDVQYDINDFSKISFENIHFNYKDKSGKHRFGVGPFNLDIKQGEILFVRGGNGSGKTTIMKLLTLLYKSDGGVIKVDNIFIDKHNIKNYQNLFSIILSDFHLFDRFYGIENMDTNRLNQLLNQMQLTDKIEYKDNKFSNINLSTGQRKRLALIMAIMEDKQIYILDEWAADQDPEFRDYFYMSILPELKKLGKTIIAVTHDDYYFNVSDRVIKMDTGKFVDLD